MKKETVKKEVEKEVVNDAVENKELEMDNVNEGSVVLNFDKVTGYTLIKCEKEAKREDKEISVPSLSMVYQAHVAAAAAGVKVDDIYSLPGKEFSKICLEAQRFLLGSEE